MTQEGQRFAVGLSFLAVLFVFCVAARVYVPLNDPNFLKDSSVGMMRSDPGLLYYMTERVIESGGLPPGDIHADPLVEYPLLRDLPALFTVGLEYPLAWSYHLFGNGMPLHLFCVWFMGIFASLTIVGVYWLAYELTGKTRWACVAAIFYLLMPANYRTVGNVLLREDFSIPFYAMHLALAARALRKRGWPEFVGASLFLVAALATWHAMRFVFMAEMLCVFIWFLRSAQNPLASTQSWVIPAILTIGALAVPVLWRSTFIFSLPMIMAAALLASAFGAKFFSLSDRGVRICGGLALSVLLLAKFVLIRQGYGGDYSHTFALLLAKLKYMGVLPTNPEEISFEARIMWQGPFSTLDPRTGYLYFGGPLLFFIPLIYSGAAAWLSGDIRRRNDALLFAMLTVFLMGTWLVSRLMFMPGILLPAAAAYMLSRLKWERAALAAVLVVALGQGAYFHLFISNAKASWYAIPQQTLEYRVAINAVETLLPRGEAIVADPVSSTAFLAHARSPIVLQPKWEESEARKRLEEFLGAFYHGTEEDLTAFMKKYRSSVLVVDRNILWNELRYMAGIPATQSTPPQGSPAAKMLSQNHSDLSSLRNFKLIYRSPTWLRNSSGLPNDGVRIYRLAR